jgi:predicted nucleic acid-binding protein
LIVAFDANILIYLFDDGARAPLDPSTKTVVEKCRERVEFLIATLQRQRATIVIPTPALAEVLVRAQEGAPERLRILSSSRYFHIASFDLRAAVEFAATQSSRVGGDGRTVAGTRAKAKFDDQIAAIAAVEGATTIYSDDPDIKRLAGARFEVVGIAELPLPIDQEQDSFDFEAPKSRPEPDDRGPSS